MFESVAAVRFKYGHILHIIEWTITILFTVEYVARILTVRKPLKYILSAYGIIDLLAILPSYISLFLPGAHLLASLRAVRLLRVFRILKLGHFVGASNMLMIALRKSRDKIFVFLFNGKAIVGWQRCRPPTIKLDRSPPMFSGQGVGDTIMVVIDPEDDSHVVAANFDDTFLPVEPIDQIFAFFMIASVVLISFGGVYGVASLFLGPELRALARKVRTIKLTNQ